MIFLVLFGIHKNFFFEDYKLHSPYGILQFSPLKEFIIAYFFITSSRPCWWTRTKDLSFAPFFLPPALVLHIIVIFVSKKYIITQVIRAF